MIDRAELLVYVDKLLNSPAFSDAAPNGLQVEGRARIGKICSAVSASEEIILEAVERKADALLVHHGFFWRNEAPEVVGLKARRLSLLLKNQVNLFAYHLPLDCHPTLGNNSRLAQLLNISDCERHAIAKTPDLLWTGSLAEPVSAELWAENLEEKLARKPLLILGSDKKIQRLAWCSGAAQDFIEVAASLGADAYLSGEVSERTYYQARELGIHYFACGHHASERYGVQALGEHLALRFGVEHHFIDSLNPL